MNGRAGTLKKEGAPVSFSRILGCRVGNLVPIDEIDTAVRSVNAYTQTIGIFPEALKHTLRDRLAYQGAQRLVSLGAAATLQHNLDRQVGAPVQPQRLAMVAHVAEVAKLFQHATLTDEAARWRIMRGASAVPAS